MKEDASPSRPLKLLVDTNVWLDYFLARSPEHDTAARFIAGSVENRRAVLYVTSLSLKDIAYQLASYLKAAARHAGEKVTPEVAAAARETAWGCVRAVIDKALIVSVGYSEIMQAFTYKEIHDDFEDDIVLGAAFSIDADYLVTHDERLAKRAPLPCLTVRAALEKMRVFDA